MKKITLTVSCVVAMSASVMATNLCSWCYPTGHPELCATYCAQANLFNSADALAACNADCQQHVAG